jgi:hypothetical protein
MKLKPLLLVPFLCCLAFSQSATPPPIVRIVSTPGLVFGGPYRSYARAEAKVDVVGLSVVTGMPQTWWIEMHPTFASIEDLDQALSAFGSLPNDSRVRIAVFQRGLSYLPEEAVRGLPLARCIRVTIYQVSLGKEQEFGQVARSRRTMSDKTNSGGPDLLYHVVAGDDAGTYIAFAPLSSLHALDDAPADQEPSAPDVLLGREHLLFRMEPRLSYVSTEFANGDPSFWRP